MLCYFHISFFSWWLVWCWFLWIKSIASNFARWFDISTWDSSVCYVCGLLSKCLCCLSGPLNCTCNCSLSWKKFLKIETTEKLLEVNYVTGKMAWLCAALRRMSWTTLILILSLMILHQEMLEGVFFWSIKVILSMETWSHWSLVLTWGNHSSFILLALLVCSVNIVFQELSTC